MSNNTKINEFDISSSFDKEPKDIFEINRQLIMSGKIKELIVEEQEVINLLIDSIVDGLKIKDRMIKLEVIHFLEKYIKINKTFLYNKDTNEIVGIKIIDEKFLELLSNLNKCLIKDKNINKKDAIKLHKEQKKVYLKKLKDKEDNITREIKEGGEDIYKLKSKKYREEDKGGDISDIEVDIIFLENKIKALEKKLIELVTNIENTQNTIRELEVELKEIKEEENENLEILNIDFGILDFTRIYNKLQEGESKYQEKIKKPENKIYKPSEQKLSIKISNVIIGISALVATMLLVEVANNIPKEYKISTEHKHKKNNNTEIPQDIVSEASKGNIRVLDGLRDVYIIGTDIYMLDTVYKGNNRYNDILSKSIVFTFIDEKGNKFKTSPKTIYYYRRNKNVILTIVDKSGLKQLISLKNRSN